MCCPHVLYTCEQVLDAGATCVKHQGWASYLIGSRAGASRIWDGQKPDTAMTQDGNSLMQYAKSQEQLFVIYCCIIYCCISVISQ